MSGQWGVCGEDCDREEVPEEELLTEDTAREEVPEKELLTEGTARGDVPKDSDQKGSLLYTTQEEQV